MHPSTFCTVRSPHLEVQPTRDVGRRRAPQVGMSKMAAHNINGQRPFGGNFSKSTPGSRSSSPASSSRRVQKLNSYLSKMANRSTDNIRMTDDIQRATTSVDSPLEPIRTTNIRRWDGSRRTTTNWDSIRRVRRSSETIFHWLDLNTLCSQLI